MTDTTKTTPRPEEIERDIRRTQEDMSRTVDRIGDQLTPRNMLNALLDQADKHDIDARTLLDGARRNPLALAMLAGGAIWLVSDSDAKLPKLRRHQSADDGHRDPYHREYVSHMAQVDWRDGEDQAAYQRRRDIARANYLMIERRHDEDESGFRQRLDDATERFREKRHAWADQARHAGGSLRDTGRSAAARSHDLFDGNPLVAGLAAAAVGAIFGTALPMTRAEDRNLSGLGEQARDLAGEQKDKLTSAAREKKDELVAKAEERTRPGDGADEPMITQAPQPVLG